MVLKSPTLSITCSSLSGSEGSDLPGLGNTTDIIKSQIIAVAGLKCIMNMWCRDTLGALHEGQPCLGISERLQKVMGKQETTLEAKTFVAKKGRRSALDLAQVRICRLMKSMFVLRAVSCAQQGGLSLYSAAVWDAESKIYQHQSPSHFSLDGCGLVTWYF